MILKPSSKDNMLELPPLALYSMTKSQLEEIIPRLISLSSHTSPSTLTPPSSPARPGSVMKPEWWPVDVPWIKSTPKDGENFIKQFAGEDFESADKLRSVVEACYEHMGHKNLLTKMHGNSNMVKAADEDVDCVEISDDDSDAEIMDVFVCFYCDEWFGGANGQTELEEHVLTHMDSNFEAMTKKKTEAPHFGAKNAAKQKPVTEMSKPFVPRPPTIHKEVPIVDRTDLPCDNGVSQKAFMKGFELITAKQARTRSMTRTSVNIDCEIVAVEGLENRPITSPRTPRSLMSQLSRDSDHSSRKRLSFCIPDEASDSEMTEEGRPSRNIQGALLNVPFSSLLGKRVKKHIKADSSVCTIKNPEQYCSTHVRNEFLDKLRFRPVDYPVTYKRKRKHCSKFAHSYKFNKSQQRDFLKTLNTGLNKDSRLLKRQMKDCKLVLKKISQEEINFWKEKKHHQGAEWIDEDISITEVEPPPVPVGGKKFYNCDNKMPHPSSIVTHGYPQTSIQARNPYLYSSVMKSSSLQNTSQALPQFLVNKVEKVFNGHQSSKLVYVPINEVQAGPKKRIESYSKHYAKNSSRPETSSQVVRQTSQVHKRPLGPASSSRRKQHFMDVRKDIEDDDISIYSESSDESSGCERSALYDNRKQKSFLVNALKAKTFPGINGNASPAKHMVMCPGGFVETVCSKPSKKFETNMGSKSVCQNSRKQFVNSISSNLAVTPEQKTAHSSFHTLTAVSQTRPSVVGSVVANDWCRNTRVDNSPQRCSMQQQQPLRIVEDVIYIDDD